MKRSFLVRTGLFIMILLVTLLLINATYTSFILPKKTFYRKETIYQSYLASIPERKIDYLFMGDSHAFHAINPEFIPSSYNYGSGAENYIKTYYKLRKVVEKENVTVGAVILELDPHTFSTRLTDKTNLFSEIELYSQFTSLDEIQAVRKESKLLLWFEAHMPFLGNGKEFGILITRPELNDLSSGGWLKNKNNFSLVDKQASALFNYQSLYEGQQRISPVSFDYFIKTLELAKKHNISVVFITYPHTREYDEIITQHNITKEDYYRGIFARVNETIDTYARLDYYSLFPDKDYLFGDPEHVNYIGSELLSKQVYFDLNALNLTRPSEHPKVYEGLREQNSYLMHALIGMLLLEACILYVLLKKRRPNVPQTRVSLLGIFLQAWSYEVYFR